MCLELTTAGSAGVGLLLGQAVPRQVGFSPPHFRGQAWGPGEQGARGTGFDDVLCGYRPGSQ